MEALREVALVVESILSPRAGYTNETRVYPPASADQSAAAQLKRDVIARAQSVLNAAKAKLSGAPVPVMKTFDGLDSDQIEDLLVGDPTRPDFQHLLHHACVLEMHLRDLNGPVA